MTIPISSIVNISISRETTAVTQSGFGVPLIVGPNADVTAWESERVREYSNIDGVAEDFATTDAEYKAAAAIFSQDPVVETVKIGRQLDRVALVQTLTISDNFVSENIINGNIDGTAITPVNFNADHDTTLADLAASIEASDKVATATVSGNIITVTAQTPGVPCTLSDFVTTGGTSQPTFSISTTTENHGIEEDLSEIREEDDDWYGLIFTERNQDHIELAAAYIETQRKIFVTCSSDSNVLDTTSTTDSAYVLSAANYDRTAVLYNLTSDDFADSAWMGKNFPSDPGTETWKFKTLSGITADNLTSDDRASAVAKNANVYVTIGGVDITEEGTMASGEFIDVIRGVDWLQARLEERIFSRLVNLPKIPFTDAGIAIIENEIRAVLENAEGTGLLADDPKYTVTVPKATDVSETDRANRILPDVTFTARLAGAIHKVTVQGVVSV